MDINIERQDVIIRAMFEKKLNKKQLAFALNFSYPTMLSKIKNPGSFKLSEAERLCIILNINLTKFFNPYLKLL